MHIFRFSREMNLWWFFYISGYLILYCFSTDFFSVQHDTVNTFLLEILIIIHNIDEKDFHECQRVEEVLIRIKE